MRSAPCLLALLLALSAHAEEPSSPRTQSADAPTTAPTAGPAPSAALAAPEKPVVAADPIRRCPSSSPALQNIDAGVRLAFLRARIHDEVRPAQLWTGIAGGSYAVLGLAQLGLASTAIDRKKVDNYASTVALLIGHVSVQTSVVHQVATDPFANAPPPPQDPEQLCHVLAETEAFLQMGASGEALNTSVLAHIATVVVNTGILLFLGLGYKHWAVGALDAVVGMGLGEAMILTQPRGLVKASSAYKLGTF